MTNRAIITVCVVAGLISIAATLYYGFSPLAGWIWGVFG